MFFVREILFQGEGDVLPRADLVSVMGIGDGEGGPAIIQVRILQQGNA